MKDIIVILILVIIIGLATLYVYKAKKSGKKCIGCPDADKCAGVCGGCCLKEEQPSKKEE